MALPSIALPGTLLGPTSSYLPGPGTHVHDSNIYASLAGPVTASTPPTTASAPRNNTTPSSASTSSRTNATASAKPLPQLSVARSPATGGTSSTPPSTASTTTTTASPLPEVNQRVLARITRIGPRHATCALLCTSPSSSSPTDPAPTVYPAPFPATLRREDIRATEKDKVLVAESYRVGDIVRAVVISLGDQGGGYYVGTAGNDLGVVMAWGEDDGGAGVDGEGEGGTYGGREVMVPRDWRSVVGGRTGRVEARKVARPF